MEDGFDTSLEFGDGDDNKKGFGVSENQGDDVFQEAIGTSQEPDLGKDEDDGSVVGLGDSKTLDESTVGVGSSSQNTHDDDDDDDDGDDNKFQEAVGDEVVNGVNFEDKVDSSVIKDDGFASPAGYEGQGDEGQGRGEEDEEESSEVVDAFLDMVHSDLTTEFVETSGLDKAETAHSAVSKGITVPEGADSDSAVLKGIPVPEGAGPDSAVSKDIPVPEGADSDSAVLKGIQVPKGADSDSAVSQGMPVPEGADSDSAVSKGIPVPEGADSDSAVSKGIPVPEGADSDHVSLNSKSIPEVTDSDCVVFNGRPVLENADSECVVLNGTPVPESAENANSDTVVLNGRPVPENADSECVVLKGRPVPESADILLQGETNGEIIPQKIGKGDEPGENILGNAYREEDTVDHAGNRHTEIQDDFGTELTGKSASTDRKDKATESGEEKGAETSLITDHGDDNVALKDLPHKGEPENITAVQDISEGKETDSPDNAAVAGSSSVKSTNAAASLPSRPAGLGRAAPLLEPAHRVAPQPRANGAVSPLQAQQAEEANGDGDEYDETREKLQMIRVKFLRLAHRLGQTPHNVVVAQVLYRLGLAEQLRGSSGGRVGAFSFDRASAMAEQLEAAGQEPLDFSCTIMVLGKSGVGKSATINSLFDEPKFTTDAFQMGTRKVQDVVGTVQGIKVRVIDTPGLLPSWSDQHRNEKILQSVKRFIKKTPPDIVLYLDRLDMQSRDLGDMPLLRTITDIFGPSIWFNAIVVLTHAASAPPDGPNGTASSYEMFVTQRSHVVQQAIRQAAGDMRLMNPVSLVENHSACRTNRAGQRVLPNGQVWKPHLLLLSFASKILGEANALLKLQDSPPGKAFVTQSRAPPLPFLLSSLLQSRPPLKLPEEQQYSDEDGLDDDLGDSSDSDNEMDYDDLPPFKSLSKAQLAKLNKDQKKAYFDELEYREKLLMKKQLKEESRRRKMMKKMAAAAKELPSELNENREEESGGAASVPVPMPDLALPASFDSDNPTHRYRYLDTSSPWLMRPVLDTNGWDHDVGYEGINVERLFVVKEKVPVSLSGQVTKDKKDSNMQMEVAGSIKHGKGKATSLGFDMQSVGKDLAYTLRSETRFSNYKKNKASAGLSLTLLGDVLSAGVKLEDKLTLNRRFQMVVSGGAMGGRGDIAYGGSLEAQLRDKDYPLGRSLSTLGLSVMDWHGDLAIGCNLQSQIPVGRSTNLIARANLNNRGSGQVSVRLNSSEQLQLVLLGIIPLLRKLLDVSQQQFGQ